MSVLQTAGRGIFEKRWDHRAPPSDGTERERIKTRISVVTMRKPDNVRPTLYSRAQLARAISDGVKPLTHTAKVEYVQSVKCSHFAAARYA